MNPQFYCLKGNIRVSMEKFPVNMTYFTPKHLIIR